METILSTRSRGTSVARSLSRLRAKSPALPNPLNRRDYILGIILLLVVVFLWTSSNFVTQAIFQDGFEKPFLVTYLNTSSFALYLLPFLAQRRWRHRSDEHGWWGNRSRRAGHATYQPLGTEPESMLEGVIEEEVVYPSAEQSLPPLTTRETIDLAFVFCFLWFIANWSVNAALNYTSVASATILSSMSGLFTLAIGRLFLVETLTMAKILAVITSFCGVVLVTLSDSSAPASQAPKPLSARLEQLSTRPILGDFLALISAVFYALYVILLKVRINSESRIDMRLFFGFVGLFNILICWVLGVILHLTGIEPFELPTTGTAVGAILLNMLITLTSDYIYVLAMLKTTPLVVTVGLSLTIPLAVVGDFFLGKSTRGQVIVGALLVLLSFVVVGVNDSESQPGKSEELVTDDLLDHRPVLGNVD
ncbi:hypothetical protein Hypma_015412 [Hypsizygus marmoreus]|uniref:Uncharacterized protein n=1 Tax=Hypsizygus marmoreus TaxID=39966 RepID=A0A369K955_HYPMA|nr:hypothetical protein Hypma_015412 [Hypsizygus marmoreus]